GLEGTSNRIRLAAFCDAARALKPSLNRSRDLGDDLCGRKLAAIDLDETDYVPGRCPTRGDGHVTCSLHADLGGDPESLARREPALEGRLGRRPFHRGLVRDRKISNRYLSGPRRQGERIWCSRVSRLDPSVDLLLGADLSLGSRVHSGVGAEPGAGGPAKSRCRQVRLAS